MSVVTDTERNVVGERYQERICIIIFTLGCVERENRDALPTISQVMLLCQTLETILICIDCEVLQM